MAGTMNRNRTDQDQINPDSDLSETDEDRKGADGKKKVVDALLEGYTLGTYEDLGYPMDPAFAGKTVDRETPIAFCNASGEIYDLITYLGMPISNTKELPNELHMIMPVNQFADNLRSALQKENRERRLKTQKVVDPF